MSRQVSEGVQNSIAVAAGDDHKKVARSWKALDPNARSDGPLVLARRQEAVGDDAVVQLVRRHHQEVDACHRDEAHIRHKDEDFAGLEAVSGEADHKTSIEVRPLSGKSFAAGLRNGRPRRACSDGRERCARYTCTRGEVLGIREYRHALERLKQFGRSTHAPTGRASYPHLASRDPRLRRPQVMCGWGGLESALWTFRRRAVHRAREPEYGCE